MNSSGRAMGTLLLLCAVVAVTAVGFAQGVWLANLHNGLLALTFGVVGAAILLQRPAHREGRLFIGIGLLEAAMFLGRQVGHAAETVWWAWLGVWPIALVLSAITVAVVCFPEGRALGPGWRRVCVVVVAIGVALSLTSALWPVEYASADISLDHPLEVAGASAATTLWSAVAHPFYAACQVLWVVAVATRWRVSDPVVRRQLSVLVGATGLCAAALLVGLVTRGSPLPGLLLVPVVPLAAGWAIERISLVRVIEAEQSAGRLDGLTPRENEVLQLMAQGLSNAAICERLHLSVKTVEPAISSIFVKLGLPSGAENNRRVLAVAEYLRTSTPSGSGASTPQ